MQIYDLNPGDLIRIKDTTIPFMADLKGKDVPIYSLKLDDSFPAAIVSWTCSDGYSTSYPFMAEDFYLVEHKDFSDQRWVWIANKINITSSYTIDKAVISKNDRYKYMWQRWRADGYYHCPYCDKPLNSQDAIEETFDEVVNECDCDGWKNQEQKYLNYLKAKEALEQQFNDLVKGTTLDEFEVDFRKINN